MMWDISIAFGNSNKVYTYGSLFHKSYMTSVYKIQYSSTNCNDKNKPNKFNTYILLGNKYQ